ncbi:MAG TPA: 4Fe-4S binding protein [Candidatus Gallimonas intestinigallinarum]|uniref:4Fe-4S binding protein n=1 Tax=Candidatus Gallimonas intestinigallinarum TaxID=2838604 RepID=A0A9D2DWJ2_9FIRM|nr:4Fe-4S binding protein [Candidatus Gallimonas intestinigallinarum]
MKTVFRKIGGFFKSIGRWFKNHAPTKRRLIQLYAALLTNANIKGFISGTIYTGSSKVMCVPGLNCYSCPGAIGACPLGALQNALANSGTRAPVYVLGILALFGIILGRTICGFLCPTGLLQDFAYKIRTPKLKKSKVTRLLSYLKYILLVVLVIAVPLAFVGQDRLIPAFCKFVCPAGTFGGAISLLFHPDNADLYGMLGPMFTWKFALFCAIAVACVFIYRAFCRFICPLGAIYGFFNKIALLGIKLDKEKCTDCGLCVAHCKMDIKRVGDHECINCGECIAVCPTKAIRWKGSKLFVRANEVEAPATDKAPLAQMVRPAAVESVAATSPAAPVAETTVMNAAVATTDTERTEAQPITIAHGESAAAAAKPPFRIGSKGQHVLKAVVYTLAALVLAGALLYYNFFDVEAASAPAVGTEVGDLCPDFTVQVYDNATGELTEQTYSPETSRGKVTVINFWGTWCDPCKAELPYFDQVASEDPDIVIVTVHSILDAPTAPEYISTNYPNSNMLFTQDSMQTVDGAEYDVFTLLGGRNSYPRTLILDSEGVITFAFTGSIHYEELVAEIANAKANI